MDNQKTLPDKMLTYNKKQIAVLIPCLNEEKTIAKVIKDFRTELPHATIYVFDNDSDDTTIQEASKAGAIVMKEKRRGKGFVTRSMFKKIDADIYIIVDGDDTYPSEQIKKLIEPVINDEADMTVGSRLTNTSKSQFRILNRIGNKFYLNLINQIFKSNLTDILSGYRCMNRKFVKSLPICVSGFEIETELTIKALQRGYRILEIPIDLRSRPEGSYSKIRIVKDGIKILLTIFALFRDYKPLTFFGVIGIITILSGLIPGIVVIDEFLTTGLILHIPSAILAVGIEITGILFFVIAITLHTINRRFQEMEYYMMELIDKPNNIQ